MATYLNNLLRMQINRRNQKALKNMNSLCFQQLQRCVHLP